MSSFFYPRNEEGNENKFFYLDGCTGKNILLNSLTMKKKFTERSKGIAAVSMLSFFYCIMYALRHKVLLLIPAVPRRMLLPYWM